MPEPTDDRWAQWLLHRRHGDDPALLQATIELLTPVRERVLDNAAVTAGDVLLDVGAGDGLIAFGALPRVGPQGTVIFSDISQDLLDYTHARASEIDALERCRFVRAAADALQPIEDASVDVVTTRSVLIYVADKPRAFAEFFRVLRPGGRISLFEPINRFSLARPEHSFAGFDTTPIAEIGHKLRETYHQSQPEHNPMLDFDERDLLTFAEQVGFVELRLELQAEIMRVQPQSWETALNVSPNPNAPTLAEVIERALTPAEAARLEAYLRPLVESGQGIHRMAVAYLWAVKPA